jgi:plasmid stabilization system protein ParE
MKPLRIEVTDAAAADIDSAVAWYAAEASHQVNRWFVELDGAFQFLRNNPLAAQAVDNGTRRWVLRSFPYCIYYSIRQDRLLIWAVLHQAQNPDILSERKPAP